MEGEVMVQIAIIIALVCLMCGCASTYEIKALPSDNISTEYKSGELVQNSFKTNTSVAAKVFKSKVSTQGEGAFVIAIVNLSQAPILITPGCISVESDGQPVKVYSYAELKDLVERRAKQQALAAVLMGLSLSMQAAQPQYTYGTVNVFGTGGFAQGIYSGYTYNPSQVSTNQALIRAIMANQISAIESSKSSDLLLIEEVIREHTLNPQQMYGGLVVFEPPKGKDQQIITLKVNLPPDIHEFSFSYVKQ
jgi:hypothetical protein